MDANFRILPLLLLASFVASPWARATDQSYEVDFKSSQAVLRAIEACKADGCDLSKYRFSVKRVANDIEVTLLGNEMSAEQLFAGDYEDVTERHHPVNATRHEVVRRWYGK